MVFSEMISSLIAWTFWFIHTYGAYSVFVVVILEELLLPIPAPLVIMGASFILIPANLPFWDAMQRILFVIVLPASIASTIGSFFTYGIGYYGGRPLVKKFHRFLRFGWTDVKKTEKKLEKGKKVWTTIAVLRAIPFFPIAIVSFMSGVLRLSWKKYAAATFIGSIPRTFILAVIGWRLGSAYVSFAAKLSAAENILAIAVVFAVLYALYRYRHKYVHHMHHHYKRLLNKHVKKGK